jgi:hypothetical protein
MVEPSGHCPYLGLKQNQAIRFASPTAEHRCYVTGQAQEIPVAQGDYCLSSGHINCPLYIGLSQPTTPSVRTKIDERPAPSRGFLGWMGGLAPRDRLIYSLLVGLLLLIFAIYAAAGVNLLLTGGLAEEPSPTTLPVATLTPAPSVTATLVPSATPEPSASPTPSSPTPRATEAPSATAVPPTPVVITVIVVPPTPIVTIGLATTTPEPTEADTQVPTEAPPTSTLEPTVEPSSTAPPEPSSTTPPEPTSAPPPEPTSAPPPEPTSAEPTSVPPPEPTAEPTAEPTPEPQRTPPPPEPTAGFVAGWWVVGMIKQPR